jgi:hypothetical protein
MEGDAQLIAWCRSALLTETEPALSHQLANEGSPLLPLTRESKELKEQAQRRQDSVRLLHLILVTTLF